MRCLRKFDRFVKTRGILCFIYLLKTLLRETILGYNGLTDVYRRPLKPAVHCAFVFVSFATRNNKKILSNTCSNKNKYNTLQNHAKRWKMFTVNSANSFNCFVRDVFFVTNSKNES